MSNIETILSQKTLTALNGLMDRHRKDFRDDIEKMVKGIAGSTTGGFMGPGAAPRGSSKDIKSELAILIKSLSKAGKTLTAYETYMLDSAKKQMTALKKVISAEEEAARAIAENSEAVDDNTNSQAKNTGAVKDAVSGTKQFVKGLVAGTLQLQSLKRAVDEFQTSYRLGFKWEPVLDSFRGAMMGMDPKGIMEFQAQFRRTSGAMAGGIDQFNTIVHQNQAEMVQYTGSLKAAAVAMGNMYELSHSMGLSLGDVAGSADGLFTEFKRMQAVTSITVDQFVEMNQRMLSNSDIQAKLLGLNQKQRAAYVQGLNQQQLELQMMGLQKEVAEQLIAATEKMSNSKGLDRLQKRYKMQAGLQAMGMDAKQASEFATLANKKYRTEGEDISLKKQMMAFAETTAQAKMGGFSIGDGVTTTNELLIDKLAEMTGLDELMATGQQGALQRSAVTNQNALSKHQTELAERQTDSLQIIAKNLSMITDALGAWSESAVAMLAGSIVAILLSKTAFVSGVLGKLGSLGGGAAGGAGGAAGGGIKGLLKGFRPGAMGAGLAIGALGTIAAQAMDPKQFAPENRVKAQIGQGAIEGGAQGAGLGMMFGPQGAVIGGALGALAGMGYEWYKYEKDITAQLQNAYEIRSKMNSGEALKLATERKGQELAIDTLEKQIKMMEEQGLLTTSQHQLLKKMRGDLEGTDKKIEVAKIKQQAMGASVANQFLTAALKGDNKFSDTGDLTGKTGTLQTMMGMAGIKGNASEALNANILKAMSQAGITDGESWGAIGNVTGAISAGKDVSIPAALQSIVSQGYQATLADTQSGLLANQAAVKAGLSPTLSAAVTDSQREDANAARDKVTQLQQQLDNLTANPDRGSGGLVAEKREELERAKATYLAQQNAADVLNQSASGEKPLTVKWTEEDLEAINRKLTNSLYKAQGRTTPAAVPLVVSPWKRN